MACHAATSAVDLDTDRAIQEIIRGPQFKDVTMLTIAYVPSHISRAHMLTAVVMQTPTQHDPRVRPRPRPRRREGALALRFVSSV